MIHLPWRGILLGSGLAVLLGCSGMVGALGERAAGDGSIAPDPDALTVGGERFEMRTIVDPTLDHMPVGAIFAPATWRFTSDVRWNYAYATNPVQVTLTVEDPNDADALFVFPSADFFELRPTTRMYRRGQEVGGPIFLAPQPPQRALATVAERERGALPEFQIVGSKALPELAAAHAMNGDQLHGVAVKVSYVLDGVPVDEEFYALGYQNEVPYDGPQGRTWQINWGLVLVHSFRAPRGTLDARRDVFAAIARSFHPNPAWSARRVAIIAHLTDQFNRELQAGYDAIAAAGRLSRQISANNDAMIAGIDLQLSATERPAGDVGEARTSADRFDDYIRGVETTTDPYFGTSQHASTEAHHWTDGYGAYRHTNDATLDPNHTEVGTWTRLEPAR